MKMHQATYSISVDLTENSPLRASEEQSRIEQELAQIERAEMPDEAGNNNNSLVASNVRSTLYRVSPDAREQAQLGKEILRRSKV